MTIYGNDAAMTQVDAVASTVHNAATPRLERPTTAGYEIAQFRLATMFVVI